MPFQKVTPEKLSCAVTRQIEKLILRGILRPGERLPAERELAERLGVSRPSLREAVNFRTRVFWPPARVRASTWPMFWAMRSPTP